MCILQNPAPPTHGSYQVEITWYSTVRYNSCYINSGQKSIYKHRVVSAKRQQPTSQIAVHPALRRPAVDKAPTTPRSDNTLHLEIRHHIHTRTSAETITLNMPYEEAERIQPALKFETTGTMSNIKIRTATIISLNRRLPRSLAHNHILITHGGYMHFRLVSQWIRQIRERRKLRKDRKYL